MDSSQSQAIAIGVARCRQCHAPDIGDLSMQLVVILFPAVPGALAYGIARPMISGDARPSRGLKPQPVDDERRHPDDSPEIVWEELQCLG